MCTLSKNMCMYVNVNNFYDRRYFPVFKFLYSELENMYQYALVMFSEPKWNPTFFLLMKGHPVKNIKKNIVERQNYRIFNRWIG